MSVEIVSKKIQYLSSLQEHQYMCTQQTDPGPLWTNENTSSSFNGVTVLTSSTTEEPELSVISPKDAAANFPQLVQVQFVIPSGVLQEHHPI